jgi:hypothetical protein
MIKLNQNQIFMMCETILFVFIAFSVYRYVHTLNTRINSVNNKLNIIETFLQQSDIKISANVQSSTEPTQDSLKKTESKQVTFDDNFPSIPPPMNEADLLNAISESFNQQLFNQSKKSDNIEEIFEKNNENKVVDVVVVDEVVVEEVVVDEVIVEVEEVVDEVVEVEEVIDEVVEVDEVIEVDKVEEVEEDKVEEVIEEVEEDKVEEVIEEVEEDKVEDIDDIDDID